MVCGVVLFRNYSWFSARAQITDWFTSHYWSLSIEEHFYLFLPGLLVLTARKWRMPALAAIIALVESRRIYLQLYEHVDYSAIYKHTDVRLDALLIPAVLAIALQNENFSQFFRKVARFWWVAAIVLLLLLTSGRFPVLTPVAQPFLIPWMVGGTMALPDGIFSRVLEWSVFRWLGRIPYSTYLWQQLFFLGHFMKSFRPLGPLNDFPFNWVAVLICASLNYYVVEKPLIRLGHKLAPPATPGRPGLAT